VEIKLRDYQQYVYDKIKEEFRNGAKGVCAVLPCRSGKSYIMAAITDSGCKKGSHVLILAHRNSLLNQHRELFETLELENPNVRIESVFTEARHLGENGPVDLIIIDEAHISGASSYQKVCEYYDCRRVLFTATPARLDGKPLNLADVIVTGIGAKELINRGKIADYEYYAPDLNLDLSTVKKSCGDFNNQELGEKMSSKKIYGDVLKYYEKLGKGQQAIAYCVNIQHSKEVCDMFNENGISAKHMDSKTPEQEREKILQEFKDGKFTILCNCNLISEGMTLPSANVGLLLRPTLSLPLFIQQACRVLTPVEGKKAIIIDYVGNVFRHGMPTMDRDWSLKKKVKEYDNENDDGTLRIRVCKECFSTFEGGDVCPYCGAEYELTAIEIENIKEVQLKKVEEERELKRQQYLSSVADKVQYYESVEQCTTWAELTEFAKMKGYKPGFAYVMAKRIGVFVPRKR
jgi:superfamily II DNA or RNA helicase